MLLLTATCHSNLPDFFKSITTDEIEEWCDPGVFYRGEEYYESGAVVDASYSTDKKLLNSVVQGSHNYQVMISLQDGNASASCTCPYNGLCKHVVASLLYAIYEESSINFVSDAKNDSFETDRYLHSLSKNVLVNLVKKFAPEQFWVETKNKFSDGRTAKKVFSQVEIKIKKLFDDVDNLYDPDAFDAALNKEFKKLIGLEKQLAPEAGQLLLDIIDEVDNASEEGYLYNHYGDYSYGPSNVVCEFYEAYANKMDFNGKMLFLHKLELAVQENSYTTFEPLLQRLYTAAFTEQDYPALKNRIVADCKNLSSGFIESCYDKLASLFSEQEKEIVLSQMQNAGDKWAIELARLYDSQGRTMTAIETIKNRLANNRSWAGEGIYSFYLDLLSKAGFDMSEAAREAILNRSTCAMLQKIALMMKGDLKAYELILEQKNKEQLLKYLESENRLIEALDLIKRSQHMWGTQVYDFFKKHKKVFLSDAEKFFCDEISKNLEFTGDSYYHAVADNLKQLSQINRPLTNKYLLDIQFNYKRRRNLMLILSKI